MERELRTSQDGARASGSAVKQEMPAGGGRLQLKQAVRRAGSLAVQAKMLSPAGDAESVHVIQHRAGVQLSGGVGKAGDAYERHADSVADRVVQGKSAEGLLSQMTGPAAGRTAVQSKAVQRLGTPLDEELPSGADTPEYGETKGKQRRYSIDQYVAMWEKEQGRKMTASERQTIERGCIGITAMNLQGGGNPLNNAEACYGTFDQAYQEMKKKNDSLDWWSKIPIIGNFVSKTRYVLFAKLFWSNQSADWDERLKPDPNAYKPDPKTGKVDMSGYDYEPQSRWKTDPNTGAKVKSSYVNFDYGFWDEKSNCFWHANHCQYKDPVRAANDPMKVFQSTKEKFTKGYIDFDRIIFCIAKAENYDPGLAAIVHAGGGS